MSIQKKPFSNNEKILGASVSLCSCEEILRVMEDRINTKHQNEYICITSTTSIYYASKIPWFKEYINGACFSPCDGTAIVLAGKINRIKIPRIHGPDLMLKCCEFGVSHKWRHYFYGGEDHVLDSLIKSLSTKIEGLITAGSYPPPFRSVTPWEDDRIVKMIRAAKPDIVWVGLGLLKQEKWIADHLERIKAPWMVGVGAAFDFLAGTTKRAPSQIRKLGFEWLYRVCFEPRLVKRNLYTISFLYRSALEALKRRRTDM
jgi:N-acetylglucosaminyldiphosphoundecaprenol N-acetyl-beta-D-mannosaminyltransferase